MYIIYIGDRRVVSCTDFDFRASGSLRIHQKSWQAISVKFNEHVVIRDSEYRIVFTRTRRADDFG